MTLLTPLLVIALIGMPVWLENMDNPETKKMEKEIEILLKETNNQIDNQAIRQTVGYVEEEISNKSAPVTGIVAAMLIYLFILAYGAMVMRGVVEEKTNRIVEIIISSVKPFELMIGKIAGIALVGLTQFLIWAVIALLLVNFMEMPTISSHSLSSFDFVKTGFFFIIYFLGGYFLYASLFAAIGAVSNSETDTQQFMLPIILPIIFAMLIAVHGANHPDGQLAFWTSLIPFTSPIVMMIRIPAGNVPAWELFISVLLLLLSFAGTTWVAAKIYRTGILMYGKKVTYREIRKWMRYK